MAMKPSKGDSLSPIRVMVVDDHAVVRGGLSTFLLAYDDLMLVGEAANGAEALQQVEQCAPDVILMDLVMPEMDGATATRLIRHQFPAVQVVALTSFKEDDLVQGVLAAGAIGYLLKNIAADELADAIRAAYVGRPTLAPEATRALIHSATQATRSGRGCGCRRFPAARSILAECDNPCRPCHAA